MTIRSLAKAPGAVPTVLDGASFVSEQLGFVYYCVPKTLSRSMLQYLAALDPEGFRIADKDSGVDILKRIVSTGAPKSFTFVRNPYSRVVALYYDKFVNYLDAPGQRALFARYERLRPDMQLAEFVDWLMTDEGNDERADPHFRSQHYFVLDATGTPAVDYLGKFESAEEDVAELQDLLGLARATLPRVNTNATRKGVSFDTTHRWLEVLDDRSKQLLTSRYEGDFELLEYQRLAYSTIPRFSRGAQAVRSERGTDQVARVAPLSRIRAVVNRVLKPFGAEVRRVRR
jgi:hypothetical protein